MSVEFWTAAETFYETWLPVAGIVICLAALMLLYTRFYAQGKTKKTLTIISVLIMGTLGTASFWGYRHYEAYLPKAKLVTPLIRDRKRGIFGYKLVYRDELDLYMGLHAPEKLRKLGFYEEETETRAVSYLGKGRYFHYFEDQNGREFKITRGVEFDASAKEPQMVGEKFYLKDRSFEEAGFFDPERIMYDRLKIPATMEGRTYEPESDAQVPKAQDYFYEWSF